MLHRGQVRFGDIAFPGRPTAQKLLVVIQGGAAFANQTDVVVLVASTYRGRPPQLYDVLCQAANPGFNADTVIDCRWPFTVRRSDVEALPLLFVLGNDVLEMIDEALLVGLQMTGAAP